MLLTHQHVPAAWLLAEYGRIVLAIAWAAGATSVAALCVYAVIRHQEHRRTK